MARAKNKESKSTMADDEFEVKSNYIYIGIKFDLNLKITANFNELQVLKTEMLFFWYCKIKNVYYFIFLNVSCAVIKISKILRMKLRFAF